MCWSDSELTGQTERAGQTHAGGFVWQVVFEVLYGAQHEGDSVGEDVVEGIQGQSAKCHDNANNHSAS